MSTLRTVRVPQDPNNRTTLAETVRSCWSGELAAGVTVTEIVSDSAGVSFALAQSETRSMYCTFSSEVQWITEFGSWHCLCPFLKVAL